jgi:hypothetical protein
VDIVMIVLRLIHILAGVFWVGGVVVLAGFLQPTAKALVPEGPKFMQRLMAGPLLVGLSAAPPLTVLAGLLMYWRDSAGLSIAWIATGTGLVFTLGGLLGISAMLVGFLVSRPAAVGLATVGKEIQAGGKPPTPEQLGKIGRFQVMLTQGANWTAILAVLALVAMASARYF